MCCHESSPSKGKNNNNNNSKNNNNKNTQHTAYLAYTKVLSHRVFVYVCVYVWEYIGRGNLSLSLFISLSAIPNSHCHSHAIANTHIHVSLFFVFLLFVLFPVWFQRSLFRLSDLSLSLLLFVTLSRSSVLIQCAIALVCSSRARTARLVLAAVNSYCGFMLVFQPSSFCSQIRKVPGELGG